MQCLKKFTQYKKCFPNFYNFFSGIQKILMCFGKNVPLIFQKSSSSALISKMLMTLTISTSNNVQAFKKIFVPFF